MATLSPVHAHLQFCKVGYTMGTNCLPIITALKSSVNLKQHKILRLYSRSAGRNCLMTGRCLNRHRNISKARCLNVKSRAPAHSRMLRQVRGDLHRYRIGKQDQAAVRSEKKGDRGTVMIGCT